MSIEARIIDDEGVVWWRGAIIYAHPNLNVSYMPPPNWDDLDKDVQAYLPEQIITAKLEQVFGEEDGGPLAIYRLKRMKK